MDKEARKKDIKEGIDQSLDKLLDEMEDDEMGEDDDIGEEDDMGGDNDMGEYDDMGEDRSINDRTIAQKCGSAFESWSRLEEARELMRRIMTREVWSRRHDLFIDKHQRGACSGAGISQLIKMSNPNFFANYLRGEMEYFGDNESLIIHEIIKEDFHPNIRTSDSQLQAILDHQSDNLRMPMLYVSTVLAPELCIYWMKVHGGLSESRAGEVFQQQCVLQSDKRDDIDERAREMLEEQQERQGNEKSFQSRKMLTPCVNEETMTMTDFKNRGTEKSGRTRRDQEFKTTTTVKAEFKTTTKVKVARKKTQLIEPSTSMIQGTLSDIPFAAIEDLLTDSDEDNKPEHKSKLKPKLRNRKNVKHFENNLSSDTESINDKNTSKKKKKYNRKKNDKKEQNKQPKTMQKQTCKKIVEFGKYEFDQDSDIECFECPGKFDTYDLLDKHLKTYHSETQEKERQNKRKLRKDRIRKIENERITAIKHRVSINLREWIESKKTFILGLMQNNLDPIYRTRHNLFMDRHQRTNCGSELHVSANSAFFECNEEKSQRKADILDGHLKNLTRVVQNYFNKSDTRLKELRELKTESKNYRN
jgi:hypothetical protein